MDNQTLSQLLDRVIAEVLAQSVAQKNVCVVVTGEDISSLPETLNCLEALELAGYQLWVNFSHSASQSALKSVCMDALIQRGSRAGFDRSPPHYEVLYLPALSVNSMSKKRWAFAIIWPVKLYFRRYSTVNRLSPRCINNASIANYRCHCCLVWKVTLRS